MFLPVTEILNLLEIESTEENGILTSKDIIMSAGSDVIIYGDKKLIALRPPVLHDGVMYVSAPILQKLFGLIISQNKDGNITVRLGENEVVEEDDSWYYELVSEDETSDIEMTDMEQIRINILNDMFAPDRDPTTLLLQMRKDGSFTDLDYSSQDLSNWEPAIHLSRIVTLCSMIYCPDNGYYRNADGINAIAQGIKYWFDNGFKSANWWFNTVAVPGYFQDIALFQPEGVEKYQDDINEVCEGVLSEGNGDSTRPFILNDPLASTQSTLRSYTGNGSGPPSRILATLKLLCISNIPEEEKDAWIQDCMTGLSHELSLKATPVAYNTSGLLGDTLNIQADYSYHDHGPSIMQNSYGIGMLVDCCTVFRYLKGTKYKITDEAADELANLILDGFRWTTHNNYYVNMTMGRNAGVYSGRSYLLADTRLSTYSYLSDMLIHEYPTVKRKNELQVQQAIYANPDGDAYVGNRVWWSSDYMAHSRENFLFAAHAPSTRTNATESILGINKKALFMGDGHYNLLKRGDEYTIQAEADWNKLAGTTVEQGYTNFSPTLREGVTGQTDFTGGVSDGLNGMTLMEYDHLGVTAKKAWFCFDNEIVCLGSDINSKAKGNIVTTVNQTKFYGEVKAGIGSEGKVLEAEAKNIDGTKWVLHDGIGYVFRGDEKLIEEHAVRNGKWNDIDDGAAEDIVGESEVFILTIDHGTKPLGASYEYILLPDIDEEELIEYSQSPKVTVVSNTSDVQAVWHDEQKIMQAAFYKAGTVSAGGLSVTSDAPCAVMITIAGDGSYRVYASDPNHEYLKLNIQLSGLVSGSVDFVLEPGERGLNAGKTMVYDSKDGILDINLNEGENTDFEIGAKLLAIAVDDALLPNFDPYTHSYKMTVNEIPRIRAKGNFPAKVETTEDKTVITVTDPENPTNQSVYVIQYTINKINQENEEEK